MSEGGSANQINALIDAERLAAVYRREPDAAEDNAERKTRVAGMVAGVLAVVGASWFVAGESVGLIVAGISALIAVALAVRWRMASSAMRRRTDAGPS